MAPLPPTGTLPGAPGAPPESETAVEAVVVGSGPAGCAAVRLLAAWGHDVVLLPGPPRRRPAHAESLPPSSWKLLDTLGLRPRVQAAGFLPCGGNVVAWESGILEPRPFPTGLPGVQVERNRFDALLLEGATEAGARAFEGAVARSIHPPESGDPWDGCRVEWKSPSAAGTLRARWLLDASGRHGVVARRGFRIRGEWPATSTLLGIWSRPGTWPGPAGGTLDGAFPTLVEAYREGWAWAVPAPGGRIYAAFMVDPRRTAVPRGAPLEEGYRGELARTRHLRALLADATLEGSPWATAATPYGTREHGLDGVLLLGDAGSFLDPLSSFGVKKALASGWLGAVVVHTALGDPRRIGAALELFRQREAGALLSSRSQAAELHRRGAERWDHPFWTSRADAPTGGDEPLDTGDPDPATLFRDPCVSAALEWLRSRDRLRLRTAAGTRRVARPAVQGREVVLLDHLANAATPRGLRYLQRVDLLALASLAEEVDTVSELLERYGSAAPPAEPPAVVGALATLLGLGLLESRDPSSDAPAPRISTGLHAPSPVTP